MEKKKYILTVSKTFLKGHPKAGSPTSFADKILAKEKIHTIRANYSYWSKIIDKVNSGEGVLILKQWKGVPYRTTQEPLMTLEKAWYQKIDICTTNKYMVVDNKIIDQTKYFAIAKNDGLSVDDFSDWFPSDFNNGIIIHFTDFKYT